jgi:hypothetical protein
MNDSLILQGVAGGRARRHSMVSVSLPDLIAFVVSLAIVIFLWLQ